MAQGTYETRSQFCRHCHAWRGSLGLEPTAELYVEHMVEVFREVWRVMRKDAVMFINMGDSYASSAFSARPNGKGAGITGDKAHHDIPRPPVPPGLKPKDLCGMPWRLAFALQADGWWLRSEIIWHKPNPMPESVRDRPTKAHETVFLLTKAARYYYDAEAVREPHRDLAGPPTRFGKSGIGDDGQKHDEQGYARSRVRFGVPAAQGYNPAGRNRRTVWTIPTAAFPGAHFATFPPKLVEPMILTSPTKCCARCGRGWERVTEVTQHKIGSSVLSMGGDANRAARNRSDHPQQRTRKEVVTLSFRPACDCGSEETVPATVLDPFAGVCTTLVVALRHSRNAIGLELSEDYCEMARQRIIDDAPLFNTP